MNSAMLYSYFILSKDSIHIIPALIIGFIIIAATWYLNQLLQKTILQLEKSHNLEHTLIKACQNIVYIFVYAVGTTLFLENFHVQMSSLLGSLGVLAVGIGFALQKALANMASGMLLLFYKPFFIGDYIISHKPKFEGKVIDINLRMTILEYKGNQVLVPNHTLYSSIITIKKNELL
ncbi:mechanosensitive ion channel [Candidatus Babeliales bacterium]|nr:mechanosensitive ion channel [Candidatus Babeliales bacterium]MBP9843906.1 mechanosensitive ion channel [Candidatus Babeliales bacterium]